MIKVQQSQKKTAMKYDFLDLIAEKYLLIKK